MDISQETHTVDIRPIGRKILVRKCVSGQEEVHNGQTWYRKGDVVIPEKSHEHQLWCEIIRVSDSCKMFTRDMEGKAFVRLAEWKPGNIHRVNDEDYVVREQIFEKSAREGGITAYIIWQ